MHKSQKYSSANALEANALCESFELSGLKNVQSLNENN
jgi:hypothetical protein